MVCWLSFNRWFILFSLARWLIHDREERSHSCAFGSIQQRPSPRSFGVSHHLHQPHTHPPYFQMRRERSGKDLFKDSQEEDQSGWKPRVRVGEFSTSLNDDKALLESRARDHDIDLGGSLDSRLCSQCRQVQIKGARETSDWRGLPKPALVHKWLPSG